MFIFLLHYPLEMDFSVTRVWKNSYGCMDGYCGICFLCFCFKLATYIMVVVLRVWKLYLNTTTMPSASPLQETPQFASNINVCEHKCVCTSVYWLVVSNSIYTCTDMHVHARCQQQRQ